MGTPAFAVTRNDESTVTADVTSDVASRPGLLASYRDVFAVRGSAAFFVAGWFGRMPRSTLGIGSVLLVAGVTGRYALAGAVAAAMVIGTALIGPFWSRAIDRLGQRRILLIGLAISTASALALLGSVLAGLPEFTWFGFAFLLGASVVDVGSVTRARWSNLLPSGHRRHTAYSLESVADESVFVIGPPVVTVLAAAISPVLGFGVGLVLGVAGCLALVLLRETMPPVHPEASTSRSPVFRRLPAGVLGALPVFVGIGMVFGAVDLSAVGVAEAEGAPAAAGYLLAMLASGSVIAGLVFGVLRFTGSPVLRLGVCAVLYSLVVPLVLLTPSVVPLGIVLLAAGLTTTPLLISAMGVIENRVDRSRLTEALAWPSTATGIGVTVASVLSGSLIDGVSAHAGFAVAAVGAGMVGVCGIVTLASHRSRSQRVTS